MAGPARTINSLQIGRGLAALAVVLFHARLGTNAFVEPVPPAISALLEKGNLGVVFFFALSGFIILHVHFDDRATLTALRAYAHKRITRIFIPYLPVALTVAIAYCILPSLSGAPRDWGWFTTLTLLPSSSEAALNVAWTLVHEMVFYLLFTVFFLGRRAFVLAMAAWAAALALRTLYPFAIDLPALAVLLPPINLAFVIGLMCAFCFRVIGLTFSATVSVVVGYAYHRLFERPALAWIRSPARYRVAPLRAA
jgi:exopolysaccharide production protein ExoZ